MVSIISCDIEYLYHEMSLLSTLLVFFIYFKIKLFNVNLILSWKELVVLLLSCFSSFSRATSGLHWWHYWTSQLFLNELSPWSSDVSVKGIASVSALPRALLIYLFILRGCCDSVWLLASRNFPCFVKKKKKGFSRNVAPSPLLLYISIDLQILTSPPLKYLWVPQGLNAQLLL